jgi:hypothetical protein
MCGLYFLLDSLADSDSACARVKAGVRIVLGEVEWEIVDSMVGYTGDERRQLSLLAARREKF